MATCEICGTSGDLQETKVEDTTLELCEDCQDLGTVVSGSDQSSSTGTTSSRSSRSSPSSSREPDMELVEDYSTIVKQERESRDMSMTDLATKIKEKDSVIRRVETGKLTPDRKLARKLESALGITLYEELHEPTNKQQEKSEKKGEQTIGDVADVRERS